MGAVLPHPGPAFSERLHSSGNFFSFAAARALRVHEHFSFRARTPLMKNVCGTSQ
jgi:hypothetical protein